MKFYGLQRRDIPYMVTGVLVVLLIGTFVGMGLDTLYSPDNNLPPTEQQINDFVLENKVKINIPELEDCTLYTLTYTYIASSIKVIRCTNSKSMQINNVSTIIDN